MPSDPVISRTLAAAARALAPYRAALAAKREEIRVALAASEQDGQSALLASQLGRFADGRIDASKFASVLRSGPALEPDALHRLAEVGEMLRSIAALRDDAFVVDIRSDGDVVAGVRDRLALLGQASPRRVAPPLIVTAVRADAGSAGLSQFLDGAQKIVMIVSGDSTPAPLVRCITPGTFVAQVNDVGELDAFWAWPRAGIAAVLPSTAARFVHNPAAGDALWQRITIQSLGAATQSEEVRQLEALAARPLPVSAPAPAAATETELVDRLTSWLLQQVEQPQPTGPDGPAAPR